MANWKQANIFNYASALALLTALMVLAPLAALSEGASGVSFSPTVDATPTNLTGLTNTQQTSFFGMKSLFYQFAPHAKKEDLLPAFTRQQGSNPSLTFQGPPQGGVTPSGLAPVVTEPPSQPQAQQYLQGQPLPHPFIQPALTVNTPPRLSHWGLPVPGDLPFTVMLPNNPDPSGMNSQTLQDAPFMNGGLASDLVQHTTALSVAQKTAEKLLDPKLQSVQASYQGGIQQTADAAAQDVSGAFQGNLGQISQPLINIADENAASPAQAGQTDRTQAQAIWIVQQMYKRFFLPLSLLLLLVGAVATQTSNFVRYSFVDATEVQNQIAQPFEGIIRAMMSLFLICGAQLAVSYFIDFGNAITAPVEQMIDQSTIVSWTQGLSNPTQNMTPAQAYQYAQNESTADATARVALNSVQALLNAGLMVLTAYQLVLVSYLFLFGPIAAALFAWPAVGTKFRTVLGTWLNGMSNCVMWRFWWCVILLCMTTRIQWLQDMGSYDPNSPWEPIVYTAFMAILAYVPFSALEFRPGDMVDSLLNKAAPKNG